MPLHSSQAQSSSQAREDWLAAQEVRFDAESVHQEAKRAYEADKTPKNEERFVATAKDVMYAVLDEAEAWLGWKDVAGQERE